jgi:hypothetical protein
MMWERLVQWVSGVDGVEEGVEVELAMAVASKGVMLGCGPAVLASWEG